MPKYETVHVTVDDGTIASGDIWKVIHPVWWTADIYHGPFEYERKLKLFSDEQRLIFALLWYISEVSNGGHSQFYSNSTGVAWKDARRAFRAIGIDEGAEIILASADRLGGDPALDREERHRQRAHFAPEFDDLDTRFYELKADVNIDQAMLALIRTKPGAFYFSGEVTRVVLPNLDRH